jgi:hypothetical protein
MTMTDVMTQDQLDAFATGYLAANPDATSKDVFAAIRATGYTALLQSFQVHRACEKVRPTPTLTSADDAIVLMLRLAAEYEWVSVFWDRGWSDSGQPAEISVIADGDGQSPIAWITREVYAELLQRGLVDANSLQTMKARKLHDFVAPSTQDFPAGDAGVHPSPVGNTNADGGAE